MRRDLYRIDDLLLRAGRVALGIGVLGLLVAGAAAAQESGTRALTGLWPWLALALSCPVALLAAGFAMRRQERQITAIWSLLRQSALLSVPELIANSDFERRDLERAVRFLNNRGLAHYVWDSRGDTIQDARLRASQLHVEKCEACGAAVSLSVPLVFHEAPRCPYCHDPVAHEYLEERRRDAIEALRAEHRAAAEGECRGARGEFSVPLFLLLLCLFWPAALGYAWLEWRKGC